MEQVIRDALGTAAHQYIFVAVVLSGVAALIASYLGSYLQTKGTHRALREDLKTLTEKVAATTRAAEEIKTRFGQSAWVEQRRWELKRELYTDLLRSVYKMQHLKDRIKDIYISENSFGRGEHFEELKARRKGLEAEVMPLWDEMSRVRGIGELVFSAKTISVLDELELARTASHFEGTYIDHLEEMVKATRKAHEELVASAKKDLDVEEANQ
jgi:hypothetical protein